jgi:hypothetical protein
MAFLRAKTLGAIGNNNKDCILEGIYKKPRFTAFRQ